MPNYRRPESLLARLGTGMLRGYVMNTERERDQAYRQQEMEQQQQFQLGRDQSNRDFQASQQEAAYKHAGEVADIERTQAVEDKEWEFLMNLGVAAAKEGAFSPDLASAMTEKFGEDAVKQLDLISKNVLAEKEAKKKGESGKEIKPVDLSQASGDIRSYLGEDVADDAIRNIVNRAQRDGVPLIYAITAEYPDPTKVPRRVPSEAEKLKAAGATMTGLEKNPVYERAKLRGVDPNLIAKFINEQNKTPDDALRFATAQTWAGKAANVPGATRKPNAVNITIMNKILRDFGYAPIKSDEQLTLSGAVDEMLRAGVGTDQSPDDDGQSIINDILEAYITLPVATFGYAGKERQKSQASMPAPQPLNGFGSINNR